MTEKKNGVFQMYHDKEETKLSSKYFMFNRKIEGEYKLYYKNNELIEICNYINGAFKGQYK